MMKPLQTGGADLTGSFTATNRLSELLYTQKVPKKKAAKGGKNKFTVKMESTFVIKPPDWVKESFSPEEIKRTISTIVSSCFNDLTFEIDKLLESNWKVAAIDINVKRLGKE